MKAYELSGKLFDVIKLPWSCRGAIEEVLRSYSDAHDGLEEERNLGFLSRHPVNGSMAIEIAQKCIRSYNEFDADKMKILVDYFGEDALYFFAREGSVCIYVRPISRDIRFEEHRMLACSQDEFSYDPHLQLFRIWWD